MFLMIQPTGRHHIWINYSRLYKQEKVKNIYITSLPFFGLHFNEGPRYEISSLIQTEFFVDTFMAFNGIL